MKKIICAFYILLAVMGCQDKNAGNTNEVVLTLKGERVVSMSNRSHLWGSPGLKLEKDSVTGVAEYREVMEEPDIFVLRAGSSYGQVYLEPGDCLNVEGLRNGSFVFEGDSVVVCRARLLQDLRGVRSCLTDYRRKVASVQKRGEEYDGNVVDADEVYETCRAMIAEFKKIEEGRSETFERYLDIDEEYFEISTQVTLPPYLNKTYHSFTCQDLSLLAKTMEDANVKEATYSMFYRQMARAYMDYLRINDPENKMGPGEEYLQNELRLGDYFGEGEVADMLRAFNLEMIGFQHYGDTAYQQVVKILPEKWQSSLERYFEEMTERKGRKITHPEEFPVVEGETLDGKRVNLKDFAGKWVFIDCWATWCGPCNFEIPYVAHLEHALAGENVVFLGISVDVEKDREKWREFVKEKGLKGVQILCPDKEQFYAQFGIYGIPHFALIDPEGRLVMNRMPRPSSGVPHHLLKAMVKK